MCEYHVTLFNNFNHVNARMIKDVGIRHASTSSAQDATTTLETP
jgi:hypothetical protein